MWLRWWAVVSKLVDREANGVWDGKIMLRFSIF